jgi:endonuclease/exonuclease/phosphatase family metal-dependent hydrolase
MACFAQYCPADEPGDMLVMTYNLRYASRQPPNSWPQRLPVAVALLEKHQPDLIGTQEGVYHQIKDLEERLVDYSWIGLGRDGGSRGEFMAVFYRHDRFEPEEFDHFWLSDTPEVVGSTTWGNSNRRMVTWVRFRDRQSDKSFYFFNTHFDHQIQAAREKSAQLVIERVEKLQTELPVVLVGDFNAAAGENPVYDLLVGEQRFEDTWNTAAMRGPLVATFHGYRGPRNDGPRIDWILIRGPVTCLSTEIVTFQQDGQLPSDHFPVMSRLQISTP